MERKHKFHLENLDSMSKDIISKWVYRFFKTLFSLVSLWQVHMVPAAAKDLSKEVESNVLEVNRLHHGYTKEVIWTESVGALLFYRELL